MLRAQPNAGISSARLTRTTFGIRDVREFLPE
jgi:hypothetical protein